MLYTLMGLDKGVKKVRQVIEELDYFQNELIKFNAFDSTEEDAKVLNDALAEIIGELSNVRIETVAQRRERVHKERQRIRESRS
tara:strand:+ start:321 stop:572 length:252 start_codon:yes stop_codon:yes gene_type:complete